MTISAFSACMSATTSCGEVVRSMLRNHCDGSQNVDYVELFLDFENAVPTEVERPVFEMCVQTMSSCSATLEDARNYGKGATEEIREALHHPDDLDSQETAASVVERFVQRIKSYHRLALRLEKLVPDLLWDLCSGPLPPEEQLDSRQALAGQLARLVDFVLDFDAIKMCTPALQNDFSFYRRSMSRGELDANEIELANQISLFLAAPTPMLSTLSQACIHFVRAHPDLPLHNTTDTLATVVNVCRYMVCNESAQLSDATRLFCIRVMVGCIILYDHVDEHGAFVRDAPINMKAAVMTIKEHTPPSQAEALLNSLRYTTKHFNHSSTPKSTRAVLSPSS